MKCYHLNTRGISLSANLLSAFKLPVVFAESLLMRATATFGDKLVFADVEKRNGKLVFSAQENDGDNRALVFFESKDGKDDEDAPGSIAYGITVQKASVVHDETAEEYRGMGMYEQYRRLLIAVEPGGVAVLSTTRKFTHWPGFFAGLCGGREWTEEVTRCVRLHYDGQEVTLEDLPEQRRQLDLDSPPLGRRRASFA